MARQLKGNVGVDELPTVHANVQFEAELLGYLLIDHAESDEVLETLPPEIFFRHLHQKIYRTMLEVKQRGTNVDLISVVDRLTETGEMEAGDLEYITSLGDKLPKVKSLDSLSNPLKRLYRIRKYQNFVETMRTMLAQG